MLELIVYAPAFGLISGSPFAVKAMCMVANSGQEFRFNIQSDPRKQPKQKMPVLHHGTKIIPDSDQIRDYLESTFNLDFDANLAPQQRATSRAIIRMIEEHLYFAIYANRWQGDKHWAITREQFMGGAPKIIQVLVGNKIRKGAVQQLIGQGMGRHSPKEQLDRAQKDITAIADLLGSQKFLFGNAPTAADYSVAPMLEAAHSFPIANGMTDLVEAHPNLLAYIKRAHEEFYPDA
ncbi:MAG: hypothetical protein COB84_04450 [Rhodobacteraceae bacterium]|nr:MAG: hypothetical protein COB84_04450 [Paracoccaceae bacterium]